MANNKSEAPGRLPTRKADKTRPSFLSRAITRAISRTAAFEAVDPSEYLRAQDHARKTFESADLALAFDQADTLDEEDMDDIMNGLLGLNLNRVMSEKTSRTLTSSSRLNCFYKRPEKNIKRKITLARKTKQERLERETMDRQARLGFEAGQRSDAKEDRIMYAKDKLDGEIDA